jgi:hypothetical protein
MSTQLIDLESGSGATGDSGERTDVDAIKPIDAGERVQAAVIDRPFENLRARTEELRQKVEELLYRADADKWIITGGNTIGAVSGPTVAFPTVSWDATTGLCTVSEAIVVQPFVAPSTDLFGFIDWAFTESVAPFGTVTFRFEANDDPLAGTILYDYQLANSIRVYWESSASLGAGVFCQATLEGSPVHMLRIVVRSDGTTNAGHVEDALNLILAPVVPDSILKFSLTGLGTTFVEWVETPGRPNEYMFNTYSREMHRMTKAVFDGFFVGSPLSVDGDGIGIWYEELTDSDTTQHGGRRQATPTTATDVGPFLPPNTVVPVTKLFKFSTEPEKIPGCIPLCRRIGTYLVFIDGTVVEHAHTATLGGEGSIDDLLARYVAHINGSAEQHTAADILFDDTNMNADWGLNPSETQEAVDLVVGALVSEGAGISGASRVHNEAIDTGSAHSETSVAGDLHGQIDDAVGWIADRAHKTKPELITGNWQHSFPSLDKDYKQNIDISTRLTLSSHGGAWGLGVDYSDIARKYSSSSDVNWSNPRSACNIFNGIPVAYPIIAQCVCNIPMSTTYLTEVGMLSRVIVSLTGHATTPRIYITDPLNEFVYPAVNLSPFLPGGTWVGVALCALSDTKIAAMFTNGTNHRVQAWDISNYGTTLTFTVLSGWGTGVALNGTGAGGWETDAIISNYNGTALYTLNSWNHTNSGYAVSEINVATHVVTSSGIGDAPNSTSVFPTGGLMCDTLNVYFTVFHYSTNEAYLCSATQLNLAAGVGGVLPLEVGNLSTEMVRSLAFDGINIYAPVQTPTGASAALYVFDTISLTAVGYLDTTIGVTNDYLTGILKNCCFDGVNLWIQEVSGSQLFLWAIDVGCVDAVTSSTWASLSPKRFSVMNYTDVVTDSGVTYAKLGPIIHDGSSIFTALESVGTSTLSGQMRRITRSCYR